jgi:predicted transposase/invertase (TIGR01784 family)
MEVVMEKIPEIKKAVRVLDILAQDKNERMMYEKRKISKIHYESGLENALLKGKIEGKIEGIHIVAQNMKKSGMDISAIVHYTGLSEEKINNL